MSRDYVPDVGDIVWIALDPQAGHEQSGHRPGVVLTPASYNASSSLVVICPMTSRIKPYPFVVIASHDPPSAILADQAKSMDWRARKAKFKGRVSDAVLTEVKEKLAALLRV